MALVPVDHRYVVESGRLIHYIALEDPATGRSVTNQVDEGAADPGTPDGPLDDNATGGVGRSAPPGGVAADSSVPSPMNGINYGMPPAGGAYSFGGNNIGTSFGDISEGVGSNLGSGFMKPNNYNFGDISAGIGPRAGGGMGELADPRAQQLQMMQGQAPQAPQVAGAPGADGMPGAPGAGGGTGATGTPADAWRNAGNAARFNPDNPVMAMQQKMMDMGMNPFDDLNPFMAMLQRAAAGLAATFNINQANNPANVAAIGSTPPDASQMFSDFLGNALKGNVFATAQSGASGLKQALDTRRAQIAQGPGNASQINPFMSALMELMNANQGEGATSLLSALQNPLAPRSLQKGYDRGLQGALGSANRNFWAQTPDPNTNRPGTDFMKFLMGI